MATINNKIVLEADPRKPIPEICSVITHFLQMWPGSEKLILEGVKKEIEGTLANLEKAQTKPMPAARPTNNRRRKKRK
jgi:hypothetical protein